MAMSTHIRNISPFVVIVLFTSILLSCGHRTDRFSMHAQFKNLNQGEFYIYNQQDGSKDTVAVNDGRFTFERSLKDTMTLVILFPNYSEIPVFAIPGAEVSIIGDASHLRDTEVTGTEDNELMTAFRLKTNEMTPPDVLKEAAAFINEHPTSVASVYLLRHTILQDVAPDYKEAYRLCTTLHEAQPQNQQLSRLHTQLEGLRNYTTSGRLPQFEAISTKGDTVSNKLLKGDVNVIVAWAAWNYDSQAPLRTLATLVKEHRSRLKVMSISLDASPSEGKWVLERDSIEWPNVCDSMMWQSPLLAQLGISWLPANIVTDKNGNIVARNVKSNELKDKLKKMLED